jgi:hypothetical protein
MEYLCWARPRPRTRPILSGCRDGGPDSRTNRDRFAERVASCEDHLWRNRSEFFHESGFGATD